MVICFEKLVSIEVFMVGDLDSTLIYRPSFSHQEKHQPSGPGCEALCMFLDSCTYVYAVPGFSYPRSVSPETLKEITASKVPIHGDCVEQKQVGANAHAGVADVKTLHRIICLVPNFL